WRNNMQMLEGALDKLLVLLHRPVEAPLNLDAYQRTVTRITSARGKNIRRFVNDTFLRFFSGVTSEPEWEDTAGQILGEVAEGGGVDPAGEAQHDIIALAAVRGHE